ncbi:MAG: flavin oxidoreductase/NADH oxidase [Clostridia bacterium]|nr:flavin oxidoreductase/NADH oxidase [Clostridia bacterium]
MKHEAFHYHSLEEIRAAAEACGVNLPLSGDLSSLFEPLSLGICAAENRIALQPMEGTDGTEDGAPGELTVRRYERFAAGGAGLIWFEAVATVPEGRASAHQLMLTENNLGSFKKLVEHIKETGIRHNGYAPVLIMQATNSGRYSKPTGVSAPLIAYNCPPLEDTPLPRERILTDDALRRYSEKYARAARLAREAGFDGIDIKCCHRYLACELLSAFTREGAYGGSYENRTRFIKDAFRAAESEAGACFLTTRLNAYDGFIYPYGWGVKADGSLEVDLTEPLRLINELKTQFKIPIIDITMGNPYKNPHVNRPYDHGNYVPPEHPFEGLGRMMQGVSEIQHAYPDLPVIGSAFSYLRGFAPNLAAGMVSGGHCAMAGFGRLAFANPDFPNQLKQTGKLNKVCVTCGGCASLLRAGRCAGCVVHDREVYKL